MNEISDRDLDELASRWSVEPPSGASFRPAVWRRIALREAEHPESGGVGEMLAALFGKPAVAVATVAAFILLGLAAAEVRFQWERGASVELMEAQYFRSIDPVSMASHRYEP